MVNTYARHQDLRLTDIEPTEDGTVSMASLEPKHGSDVAAIVVQSPNFFGNLEPLAQLADLAHRHGALLVVAVAEALSFGIVAPPGPSGADIVCGEAQSLGVPSSFGGPHVGFLTCRERFLRNLPGRLIGQTVDSEGKRGYVLTLSTREQHIRREKATSNICTNQSLFALMATIYCTLLGKKGIREVAVQNVAKTQYALSEMKKDLGLEGALSRTTLQRIRRPATHSLRECGREIHQRQDHSRLAIGEDTTLPSRIACCSPSPKPNAKQTSID